MLQPLCAMARQVAIWQRPAYSAAAFGSAGILQTLKRTYPALAAPQRAPTAPSLRSTPAAGTAAWCLPWRLPWAWTTCG